MKSKNITLGGIMMALSIVILYLATIIPINTIAIMTIASSIIAITILRSDVKTACTVYIGTTILGFFLVPLDFVIYYGVFFGVYGIVKYYIERLRKLPLEIILKLIVFNSMLILISILLGLSFSSLNTTLPSAALILGAQVVFIIYDYALTIIITFYLNKIHKK